MSIAPDYQQNNQPNNYHQANHRPDDYRKRNYPEDLSCLYRLVGRAVSKGCTDCVLAKAIDALRNSGTEAESLFYVYVVDDEDHLLGVFSLSDLILAKPNTPIADFMHKKIVTANVLEKQDMLAQMVSKYNLLTLPEDTIVRTGHGDHTTIGREAPHLEEWIRRGH